MNLDHFTQTALNVNPLIRQKLHAQRDLNPHALAGTGKSGVSIIFHHALTPSKRFEAVQKTEKAKDDFRFFRGGSTVWMA